MLRTQFSAVMSIVLSELWSDPIHKCYTRLVFLQQ